MTIIAHRGLLNGQNSEMENKQDQIDKCINLGFDVEVDLWMIDKKFYLGHDYPKYIINLDWLIERKNSLWIHCKNLESLDCLSEHSYDLNFFFHDKDPYTLTSKSIIWAYPKMPTSKNTVIVSLDASDETIVDYYKLNKIKGICTDYPIRLREIIN